MSVDRYAGAARDAWHALERSAFTTGWFRFHVNEGSRNRGRASLWTLTHVIAAASDVAQLGRDVDLDRLLGLVSALHADEGYLPTRGSRLRFFDDNAWLGLLSLRLHARTGEGEHRRRAERIARFLRRGLHPEGGVRWREGHESRNACSTAPTGQVLAALGAGDDIRLAADLAAWLDTTLTRADGLLADRVEEETVTSTAWTYNQGAAIGLHRRLADATSDPEHRARAALLAHASLEAFDAARTWAEPPPFLAIWFRELLCLWDVAELARERASAYADRLLGEALDPATGLFTAGGIGSYDGRDTIDQAAVVQVLALAAGVTPSPSGEA